MLSFRPSPIRLQRVQRVLADAGSTSVYELGVGDATPLITLAGDGLRVAGNDISAEMVKVARANMQAHGLDPLAIAHLDVQDEGTMAAEHERAGVFDAVMALGVIPHVADDTAFVQAMDGFLSPGGRLVLQFRNSLFSMFTFNRLTKEFILDDLLADVDPVIRDVVRPTSMPGSPSTNLPSAPRPTGDGYDGSCRASQPFELASSYARGLQRPLPLVQLPPRYPMIADRIDPMEYRRAQVAMEPRAPGAARSCPPASSRQSRTRPSHALPRDAAEVLLRASVRRPDGAAERFNTDGIPVHRRARGRRRPVHALASQVTILSRCCSPSTGRPRGARAQPRLRQRRS